MFAIPYSLPYITYLHEDKKTSIVPLVGHNCLKLQCVYPVRLTQPAGGGGQRSSALSGWGFPLLTRQTRCASDSLSVCLTPTHKHRHVRVFSFHLSNPHLSAHPFPLKTSATISLLITTTVNKPLLNETLNNDGDQLGDCPMWMISTQNTQKSLNQNMYRKQNSTPLLLLPVFRKAL